MSKTILAFGELLWDILPDGAVLGGAPANFAYRVCNLGDACYLISRLGNDELGKKARQKLREMGMDDRHVQEDTRHPTGTVDVFLDENRIPDYTINAEVAYDYIEKSEALLALAGKADCFSNAILASSLQRADILKINVEELEALADMLGIKGDDLPGQAAELLENYGLQLCLITFAEEGALAVSRDTCVYDPGYASVLVDPLGCGDAFSAAFIQAYARGKPLADCLQAGNRIGGLVAGLRGATEAVCTGHLEDFENKNYHRRFRASLKPYSII